jgi:hypothetical protein
MLISVSGEAYIAGANASGLGARVSSLISRTQVREVYVCAETSEELLLYPATLDFNRRFPLFKGVTRTLHKHVMALEQELSVGSRRESQAQQAQLR